jgi:hypothetical protein
MVERDGHRPHAPPAVAVDVVALDRRGGGARGALEPADDEDMAPNAGGGHLRATQQRRPQRGPPVSRTPARCVVAVTVAVRDHERARGGDRDQRDDDHKAAPGHDSSSRGRSRGSYPEHSTTGSLG